MFDPLEKSPPPQEKVPPNKLPSQGGEIFFPTKLLAPLFKGKKAQLMKESTNKDIP